MAVPESRRGRPLALVAGVAAAAIAAALAVVFVRPARIRGRATVPRPPIKSVIAPAGEARIPAHDTMSQRRPSGASSSKLPNANVFLTLDDHAIEAGYEVRVTFRAGGGPRPMS